MLPLCKFYRYLIYKLYHFSDDTPVFNVIMTLMLVHLYQLLTIIMLIESSKLYDFKLNLVDGYRPFVLVISFSILHFLLFYNKKRWKAIEDEFKNESPRHKKIGTIIVIFYVIGSAGLFFTSLFMLPSPNL